MDSTFPLAKAADAHRRLETSAAHRQDRAGGVGAALPHQRRQRGDRGEGARGEQLGQRAASSPPGRCTALAMNTERGRPRARRQVRVEAVADGEDARLRHGAAREPVDAGEGALVDRQVRLAGVGDLAALGRVGRRERAGAVDELCRRAPPPGPDWRRSSAGRARPDARTAPRSRPASPWCRRRGPSRRSPRRPRPAPAARRGRRTGPRSRSRADVQQRPAGPGLDQAARRIARGHAAVVGGRVDAERGHVRRPRP